MQGGTREGAVFASELLTETYIDEPLDYLEKTTKIIYDPRCRRYLTMQSRDAKEDAGVCMPQIPRIAFMVTQVELRLW